MKSRFWSTSSGLRAALLAAGVILSLSAESLSTPPSLPGQGITVEVTSDRKTVKVGSQVTLTIRIHAPDEVIHSTSEPDQIRIGDLDSWDLIAGDSVIPIRIEQGFDTTIPLLLAYRGGASVIHVHVRTDKFDVSTAPPDQRDRLQDINYGFRFTDLGFISFEVKKPLLQDPESRRRLAVTISAIGFVVLLLLVIRQARRRSP